jgi:hypothetical protein
MGKRFYILITGQVWRMANLLGHNSVMLAGLGMLRRRTWEASLVVGSVGMMPGWSR